MGIDVTYLDDRAEWNDLVAGSSGATPFHRYESLSVIADHTGSEFVPFVGHKGQEPVGLFPVFAKQYGPLRTAFSPPPDREISYLGPVELNSNGMKRRKRERRHRRFIEGVLDRVDDRIDPHYVHVRTGPDYADPRHLVWQEFDLSAGFTYSVDISPDVDDLLLSFSSDLRSNVRGADEDEYEIRAGDAADMERVVRDARSRHEEQGLNYGVTPEFIRDLAAELPDSALRCHVCETDDGFVGGLIALEDDDVVYSWQTVSDFDADVPAADLLNLHTIRTAKERGISTMDLVGANNERLCSYKAKFGPTLQPYYELERCNPAIGLGASLYSRLR